MFAPLVAKQKSAAPESADRARQKPRRVNDAHGKTAVDAVSDGGVPAWNFGGISVSSAGEAARRARRATGGEPERRNAVPAKLRVGRGDDPLEHEADRVAEQAMRMGAVGERFAGAAPHITRARVAGDEQRSGGGQSAGNIPSDGGGLSNVHEVLGSRGEPLDAATRAFMEPRLGRDFGSVRVHTGSRAGSSASSVGAAAYAAGYHLVFGTGRFEPRTHEGRELIAHELTHVAQHGGHGGREGAVTLRRAPATPRDTKRALQVEAKLDGLDRRVTELLYVLPEKYDPKVLDEIRRTRQAVKEIRENLAKGAFSQDSAEWFVDKREEYLQSALKGDPALETLGRIDTEFIRSHRAALKSAFAHDATRAKEISEIFEERQHLGTSANIKEPGDLIASSELERDVLEELGITPQDVPGGAKVPEHFDVGNFGHAHAEQLIPDLPAGLDKEVVIHLEDGTVRRADRVHWNDPKNRSKGGIVFEIKPNTRAWEAKGQRQADLYARYLNQLYGGEFRAEVRTYNRQRVTAFVRDLRAAPGTPATHTTPPFVAQPPARDTRANAVAGDEADRAPKANAVAGDEVNRVPQVAVDAPVASIPPKVSGIGVVSTYGTGRGTGAGGGSSAGAARDILLELQSTQTTLTIVSGATIAAWSYLHFMNLGAHIEEVAKAVDMAAALKAGKSPFQEQIDAAYRAEAHAKEVQKYFNSLDLRPQVPRAGDWQWDSGYQLSQIQLDFQLLEVKLQQDIKSLAQAQEDLKKELQDLADGLRKREEALLFPITSLPYADAYLFAEAGGRINPSLSNALDSYHDSQLAAESVDRFALAATKTIMIRAAELWDEAFPKDHSGATIDEIKHMNLSEFRLYEVKGD